MSEKKTKTLKWEDPQPTEAAAGQGEEDMKKKYNPYPKAPKGHKQATPENTPTGP